MQTVQTAFPSLSVIIPAYNAETSVLETIADVASWLERVGVPHEIIVVDDGSADRTAQRAEGADGVRVIRNDRNRGKGFSVRTGMLAAQHEWRLFMDVDNSTRIVHLERFAEHADEADVLIASRRLQDSRIVRPQARLRQVLGRSFPYLVRAIALPEIRDTQCGFKLFRAPAAVSIFQNLRCERFAFDVETLLLAKHRGDRIREVAVDWDNPTDSTLRIGTDTFQMFFDLLRITARCRWRRPTLETT